jgi:hypothetical protein
MMASTQNAASTPSWLQDEDKQHLRANVISFNDSGSSHGLVADAEAPAGFAGKAGSPSGSSTNLPVSDGIIHLILRITSMGLCLLMAFTAIIGLGLLYWLTCTELTFRLSILYHRNDLQH